MDFKKFYEWYHRDRKLPKRIIGKKNFTYRIIIDVLDKYCKSEDVLDIGSGVGTIDFYLAKKGKKITGIEISENAFDIAQESLKLFNLDKNITFKRYDYLKKDIRKKYSFVICSEVLEHLPNDVLALKKIYKSTKKRGLFMLTVPSTNAPLIKLGSINNFDKRSGHLRRYNIEQMSELLKKIGFKPIYFRKSEGILRNALFVYSWGSILTRAANRISFVSDIITYIDDVLVNLFGESQIIIVSNK